MILLACLMTFAGAQTDARWNTDAATRFEFQMPKYASLAEWKARREHLRKQVMAAAGLLPMPSRGKVQATIFDRLDRDGYSIEKVYIETLPGYYLGGNLYRPRKQGKFPGILSPHGHWKRGRLEHTDLASVPGRSINLARQGYVVFAYDMVGYNDTKQTPHEFGGDRESLYTFNPFALQTWNSIRALDFLESLPDVDPKRLGVTGASGGGTQTFILAAIDDRVTTDVPVNMISGHMQGGSFCENAPGLRHDTTNVDIGALMAPRPMLMVAATGDWTRNVPKLEFPAIKAIYALYDRAAYVETVQFDSPHNYHQRSREAMYSFFAKHLQARAAPVAEQPFAVEKDEDMLVWAKRQLPAGARDLAGVFEEWKRATAVKRPDREALRYALSVEVPARVESENAGERLIFKYRGSRVPVLWRPGKGVPVLVVHPEGASTAHYNERFEGRAALFLDAFNTGAAVHPRDTSVKHFYTFHRTDAQNRVQDILTALAWLQNSYKQIELRGIGQAATWCLFAAAVTDAKVKLNLDPVSQTDDELVASFYVPGIQRAGGVAAAKALAGAK